VIVINCSQGSREWLNARAGAITASEVSTALSVMKRKSDGREIGDPTAASDRYATDTAFERISGEPYGEPPKSWILERGHELEPQARMAYEIRTGNLAGESGLILTDDRKFGYSSDGIVGDDRLIEIKCPIDSVKIRYIRATHDLSEYQHQIQTGLWITGRKWRDFIMYAPALKAANKSLFYKRVMRDDDFINDMEKKLWAFDARVESIVAELLAA